jgi:hypothetical protein
MIPTRPRVDRGVPSGGEFTATAHSDSVPSLGAPAADTLDALDAARLRIDGQKQYLKAQEAALKASTDRIAGASAASTLLKHYPTAAKVTYRRDQFNSMTFLALHDHEGTLLMDEDRISGSGRYDPAVQNERFAIYAAMRHLNDVDLETLKSQGVKANGNNEVLHLDAAIASVSAGLDVDPDPYTDPLSAHSRMILVDAAKEGRQKIGGALYGDEGVLDPEVEEDLRHRAAQLDRMFGYDRPTVR